MNKPNNTICSECFIKNNVLRCMTCTHKTPEYVDCVRARYPCHLIGEHDNFKKKENEENK